MSSKNRKSSFVVLALAGLVFVPGAVLSESEHHEVSKHHLGLFLGSGWETKRDGHEDDKGLAVGLEYVYRLRQKWGIGGVVETLGDETIREITFVVPVSFHPAGGWRLFTGPGYETTEEHDHLLWRLGVGYGFHLGKRWSIAPEGMVDLVETGATIWIGGVAIGYHF